jgi:hypothetical protein
MIWQLIRSVINFSKRYRHASESVVEFDWNYLLTLNIGSIRNSCVQKGRLLFHHVVVEIFKRYLIASSVFANDDVLVAAGVVDPLVASKIGLVFDGQAQVGSRVAGRSFFEFNSFRDQLESGRPNNPQTGVSLGSNSGPVGVVVTWLFNIKIWI